MIEKNMKNAIDNRLIVNVTFSSNEKGIITRKCVPFDIGLSSRIKDGLERYHFYDLNGPDGKHNLSILPSKIVSIVITTEIFEPANYVSWTPQWHYKRDWGQYS